jgi:hypothetical protein
VQRSLTLLFVTCLAAPGIASAQIDIPPVPVPAPPPPLRLFKEAVPEPSSRPIEAIKSSSWWEAPARGNEIPRWAIGQTVTFNPASGFALSAGVFGRRGDPLPLFLSQGVTRATERAVSNSVTDPANYRLRWDAMFGVAVSLQNGPKLKLDAIGEVFLPLTVPSDTSPAFRPSGAFRLGIKTAF